MYIKVRFRCKCGCINEFSNETTATKIYCANCGKSLPERDSTVVLTILHSMNELPDDYESVFNQTNLQFITSPWECGNETPKDTGCNPGNP